VNRYSPSVGQSRHYDLLITSQCDAKGRVMGITWRMTALVSSGFFVLTQFCLLDFYVLSYRFNIVLSLIQIYALYDSNKDFTYNYYCGFSWIVRFGDPVDQWSERF